MPMHCMKASQYFQYSSAISSLRCFSVTSNGFAIARKTIRRYFGSYLKVSKRRLVGENNCIFVEVGVESNLNTRTHHSESRRRQHGGHSAGYLNPPPLTLIN